MKKVEAIIRKSKFSKVKKALHEVGVNFFSYWDVTGLGNEKEGHVYRGVSYSTSDIQRRYLSIVVNDDFEEVTIKAILTLPPQARLETEKSLYHRSTKYIELEPAKKAATH